MKKPRPPIIKDSNAPVEVVQLPKLYDQGNDIARWIEAQKILTFLLKCPKQPIGVIGQILGRKPNARVMVLVRMVERGLVKKDKTFFYGKSGKRTKMYIYSLTKQGAKEAAKYSKKFRFIK